MADKSNELLKKIREKLTLQEQLDFINEEFDLNTIPIDLSKVYNKFDIKVYKYDFEKLKEKTNKEISGAFIKGKKIILVNEKDSHQRKRFTIAHELAHYLIDDDNNEDITVNFRGMNKDETESKCEEFASKLLMPTDKIMKVYNEALFPTASYLAEKFDVSVSAMKVRLRKMGLNYIEF